MSEANHNRKCAVVVLAAGQGTRMQSARPKVMHTVACEPMLKHVLRAAAPLQAERTIVVIGKDMDEVRKVAPDATFVEQVDKYGTGGAALAAVPALKGFDGTVVILCGDVPLVTTETLTRLADAAQHAYIAVLGMHMEDPTGYGRLVMELDTLVRIVEERDAKTAEKKITFCNSGMLAVKSSHLEKLLSELQPHNAAGEYYLTDIVKNAHKHALRCIAVESPAQELQGINTRMQMVEAEAVLQSRLRREAIDQGVTLMAPETIMLCADTKLARDVLIHPYVVFGPGVTVEEGAEIKSFSHIEGANVGARVTVGPFARLRPGTVLEEDARIGNFVEVKNSRIESGAKVNHLSYVGDAHVGAQANIGAGTITCNYDGKKKHKTTIGAHAFVGSNTALVAPVTVGEGAMVGAGSVITEDVPEGKLALARGRQVNKP